MAKPNVTFNPSRPYSPWRVYHRRKSYWFPTEEEANKKKDELGGDGRARLSTRQIDEYLHARDLLKGVPVLRAARFFLEHNAARERERGT